MKELSNIPSIAILQAIEDLTFCHNDSRYVINFDNWFVPRGSRSQFEKQKVKSFCEVCFAGSVIANRIINHDITKEVRPCDFPSYEDMLHALDWFRQGQVVIGLSCLNIKNEAENMNVNQNNLEEFVKDMIKISDYLKSIGH